MIICGPMRLQYFSHSDAPSEFKLAPIEGRLLIGGQIYKDGFDRKTVRTPCWFEGTSEGQAAPILGTTPNVNQQWFAKAVNASSNAWAKGTGVWPSARMEDRILAVTNFRNKMVTKRNEVAKMLMWEIAKPWTEAQAEFDRTITYIDDTIEAAKQLDREGSRIQFAGGMMAQVRRAPLGVTLVIGPFNYPLNETFTTLIPALIVGNVAVVKAPRFGQLFWDYLLEAFQECFPPGVVNIVNGLGRSIIAPSIQSGEIDALALIGSSAVANTIKQQHPRPNSFRGILGLDAKNPAIVLPEVDLELAATECAKGALSFNGQRCTALKMIFVHKSRSKQFTNILLEKVARLKAGLPWEQGVSITPLPDPKKPSELRALMDEALSLGAKLCNPETGGKTFGTLMLPAVLDQVPLSAKLANVEQFGPIIPITEFESDDELENYMMASPFGMQASLFGDDANHLGKLIDFLSNQVCRINLNSQCQRGPDVFPFTGRKASAEGTLSVTDALRCFSIRSMVAAKQDTEGKRVFRAVLESEESKFLSTHIVL